MVKLFSSSPQQWEILKGHLPVYLHNMSKARRSVRCGKGQLQAEMLKLREKWSDVLEEVCGMCQSKLVCQIVLLLTDCPDTEETKLKRMLKIIAV